MTDYWKPPSPEDVKALRARHKITQVELADIVKIDIRTAQRWEQSEKTLGHTYPTRQAWELALIRLGEMGARDYYRRKRS